MEVKRVGASKASHRVAKRMIERLEKKELIQVDHTKFARLTMDRSLSKRVPWTLPGGTKLELEEKYSMNFWRAMNTPGDRIDVSMSVNSFDDDVITDSKAFAKAGRDIARRMLKDGLRVRHKVLMDTIPRFTVNTFQFEITAHFATYRAVLQPILRALLKPFPDAEVHLSVTHYQLESYAKDLLQREARLESQGDF
ncbi:MAG: hypothetical protein EOP07_00325 [Proteobacteria bacterium]|nr:MAG: hypothetical protein EOP07_00325 [Pseudomonadota bacterium]